MLEELLECLTSTQNITAQCFFQFLSRPRIDITNVYEKSARSAKEGPVVGWGLRRRKRGGGRRRRRTRGEICAAPFYAAILTSQKTSFLSSNQGCGKSETQGVTELRAPAGEFNAENFVLVRKPDTK